MGLAEGKTSAFKIILISWVEFPEACFGFDLSVQYVFQNAPELAPGFFTLINPIKKFRNSVNSVKNSPTED
jgi:hypothetical protein